MLNYVRQFINIRVVFHTLYIWNPIFFGISGTSNSLSDYSKNLKKIYWVGKFRANVTVYFKAFSVFTFLQIWIQSFSYWMKAFLLAHSFHISMMATQFKLLGKSLSSPSGVVWKQAHLWVKRASELSSLAALPLDFAHAAMLHALVHILLRREPAHGLHPV